MKLQKISICFLVLALTAILALGCNGAAPAGEKYSGECTEGYAGPIKVDVFVDDDGNITDIEIVEESETTGIGDADTMAPLLDEIIANNGTAGVDVKSGATVTSEAIFNAVNDALSKAE